MSIKHIKTKRAKTGPCNICRRDQPLTWDHVPPQGGVELTPMEQQTILDRLAGDQSNRSYSISQNGVKFRTICKDCNSRLGSRYDPILNQFALEIGRILKSTLYFPSVINIPTKPNALIRAILGHLLAAKADIDDTLIDQKIRPFIFDETASLPDNIKIFYWIYPYESVVILRDVIMPAVRGQFNKLGSFSIFKYFPIAYLVADLDQYEGLNELTVFQNLKANDLAKVPINLQVVHNPQWPEIVDNGNFLAGGQSINSSLHAIPRKKS